MPLGTPHHWTLRQALAAVESASAAKAVHIFMLLAASLKRCPDTDHSSQEIWIATGYSKS
jgi:hypothetical protein